VTACIAGWWRWMCDVQDKSGGRQAARSPMAQQGSTAVIALAGLLLRAVGGVFVERNAAIDQGLEFAALLDGCQVVVGGFLH